MKLFNEIFARKPQASSQPLPQPAKLVLYRLETARGFLGTDEDGRVGLEGAQEGAHEGAGLVLCVPQGGGQASFLLAADGRPIGVEGDGFVGPAVSVRLRRLEGGRAELRHPLAPMRYLGVVPGAQDRPSRVLFDRVGDAVLDRVTLHPVGDGALAPAGLALLGELALAARPPMTGERVLTLLLDGRIHRGLAEGLLRALPADALQHVAARLMRDAPALAALQLAMPGDVYLKRAVPALLAWEKAGRLASQIGVSAASEAHVSVLQAGQLRPQAGLAINALARRLVAPRQTAAVLATACNEGPYLLDWVAHHKAAGFARIVIYSNDNDDGSDELLGHLAAAGEIVWVRNELALGATAQWKAYGHALQMLPDLLDCRWAMVLDLDEYVSFEPGLFAGVGELAAWFEFQPVDAVALRRLTFVSAPGEGYHDAPSTQRLLLREAGAGTSYKTLLRPCLFWASHRHFPYAALDLNFAYRTEDGSPFQPMRGPAGARAERPAMSASHAWVAHHAFRTPGEALMKAARGGATSRAGAGDEAARLEDVIARAAALAARPGLVADRRTLDCAPGAAAEAARLRSLPGVAQSDASIRHRFAAGVEAARRMFVEAPARQGESVSRVAFRAMLMREVASEDASLRKA